MADGRPRPLLDVGRAAVTTLCRRQYAACGVLTVITSLALVCPVERKVVALLHPVYCGVSMVQLRYIMAYCGVLMVQLRYIMAYCGVPMVLLRYIMAYNEQIPERHRKLTQMC